MDAPNPAEKCLVAITGHEAVVHIEDAPMDNESNGPPPWNGTTPDAAVVTLGQVPVPRHNNVNGQLNQHLLLRVIGSTHLLHCIISVHNNSFETPCAGMR